ncbi:Uncharacterised protein [Mycobacteroides abscessus subsp. abscessus]|nr:Uncharacterised protein [Mycobacteroides abscessus subsp. abscessus]
MSVACIGGNPLLRFSNIENEAHAEHDAALEGDASVLRQADGVAFHSTGWFEQGADTADRNIVGDSRCILGDGATGAPHGGVFEVGASCWPGAGLDGAGDGEPGGDHGIEADFAGITLCHSICRDKSDRSIRLQQ